MVQGAFPDRSHEWNAGCFLPGMLLLEAKRFEPLFRRFPAHCGVLFEEGRDVVSWPLCVIASFLAFCRHYLGAWLQEEGRPTESQVDRLFCNRQASLCSNCCSALTAACGRVWRRASWRICDHRVEPEVIARGWISCMLARRLPTPFPLVGRGRSSVNARPDAKQTSRGP